MNQQEYEERKALLKRERKRAQDAMKGKTGLAYAQAVKRLMDVQELLENHYRSNLGPQPTRAERRCAKLRAKGITPVWERP